MEEDKMLKSLRELLRIRHVGIPHLRRLDRTWFRQTCGSIIRIMRLTDPKHAKIKQLAR